MFILYLKGLAVVVKKERREEAPLPRIRLDISSGLTTLHAISLGHWQRQSSSKSMHCVRLTQEC
jgi:hypothetical protein